MPSSPPDKRVQILRRLADGGWHSGQALARELGISRSAVWQQLHPLAGVLGGLQAQAGRGYRLPAPLELLQAARIRRALTPAARAHLQKLETLLQVDSTNQHLLERLARQSIHAHVLLAEYQSAGRGRRGRVWQSPLGSGICLSLGWQWESLAQPVGALSLAVGVAVARVLETCGARSVQLKWPNDVLCGGGKLAGILIEMRGELAGTCTLVIGIGINYRLSAKTHALLDTPATDFVTACAAPPSRNLLVAALLNELLVLLGDYARAGWQAYRRDWERYDLLRGNVIRLHLPHAEITARAQGVADDGALRVEHGGQIQHYHSGDVTVRSV